MKKSEPFIQLQQSLKAVAERVAAAEGVSPYQPINIAVSEKLSALETGDFFKGGARRGNPEAFLKFLDEAGDEPPVAGDRLFLRVVKRALN
ncbi:MAG: hypothetical protein ACLP7P_04175 [Rhodomicrobium sp.]